MWRLHWSAFSSQKEWVWQLTQFLAGNERSGLNRIGHPDWVKLSVELNCTPNQNTKFSLPLHIHKYNRSLILTLVICHSFLYSLSFSLCLLLALQCMCYNNKEFICRNFPPLLKCSHFGPSIVGQMKNNLYLKWNTRLSPTGWDVIFFSWLHKIKYACE